MRNYHHLSVLASEVVEFLNLTTTGLYIDCTIGGGGHAELILEKTAPSGKLWGIDKDAAAIDASRERLKRFKNRFSLFYADFTELGHLIETNKINEVNGVLFDLGVSSYQLDCAERGFSFTRDGPLDMRMDLRQKYTAKDLINSAPADRLSDIIKKYGEERLAKKISKLIVQKREKQAITTTQQLTEIIKEVVPSRGVQKTLARVFQAIRISINDELNKLKEGITQAIDNLSPSGRICIISYHSLEDRITKQIFNIYAKGCICPPGLPVCICGRSPILKIITRKAIVPSVWERKSNPRARSAKLRVAERLKK